MSGGPFLKEEQLSAAFISDNDTQTEKQEGGRKKEREKGQVHPSDEIKKKGLQHFQNFETCILCKSEL